MLASIGALAIAYVLLRFLYAFVEIHLLPGKKLSAYGANVRERGKGSWAVVTGATDGIGREFAVQLAENGFNIVLISRTQAKLDALAEELVTKYRGTLTSTCAMDFSKTTEADYERLRGVVGPLDVAVLGTCV